MSRVMNITNCTQEDFLDIHKRLAEFWAPRGEDFLRRVKTLHHPLFVNEFANTAYVMKKDGEVVAYLLGLFSQKEPAAYIHLLCVHPDHQRRGLAARLCEHFIAEAKAHGCKHLKSATSVANAVSIAFHKSLGMSLLGEPNEDGIPVVRDYSGPGEHRVVFWRNL